MATTAQAQEIRTWRGTETPDYTVVEELEPGVEIRDYPEMVMAAVTVEGDKERASGRAFRKLAGYIFGGNSGSLKIAMTTPVVSKPATMIQYAGMPVMDTELPEASETWTQAFILPSEYAVSDLPAPEDADIRIFRTKPYRVATLAFQGAGTPSQYAEARATLARELAQRGIEHADVPEYAGYDAPWVDPRKKRHEVHYRLED